MRKERIPVKECHEKMTLSEDLYDEKGLLLLTKGTRLTQDKINMLTRRGVEVVAVDGQLS